MLFEGVPVVTFYVGPDKVPFHVHQNLLFDASPVFKAAFSGDFKEASERSMPLPEDDKDSVERMIQWLYTKKLDLTVPVPVSSKTSAEYHMRLAKLNTLAEKYDICLLKNQTVDELFNFTKLPNEIRAPNVSVVRYVYDNTMEGSSFRKLMVAWYTYRIDLQWYDLGSTRGYLSEVPPDFAIDLAIALGRRLKYPDRLSPFTLSREVFYEKPPKGADEDHT